LAQGHVFLVAENQDFGQLENVLAIDGARGEPKCFDPHPRGGDALSWNCHGGDAWQDAGIGMDFTQQGSCSVVGRSGCDPEFSREAVCLKSIARIPPDRRHKYDFVEQGFLFELDLDPFRLPGGCMRFGAVADGSDPAAQAGMGELAEFGVDLFQPVLQFGQGEVFRRGFRSGGHAYEHFRPYDANYKNTVRFFHRSH
jgi:hypothetical protein